MKPLPPQAFLQEVLDYDPSTGVLIWKYRPREHFSSDKSYKLWNTKRCGAKAFNIGCGRRLYGMVDGERWFAHRIIWKLVYGSDPELIDHVDGNPFNNRISNLRSVDIATSNRNMSVPRRNKSGFIGVRKSDKSDRWVAFITFEGRRLYLGTFDNKTDAVAARVEAEKKFGFHPNHGRDQATLAPRSVPYGPYIPCDREPIRRRQVAKALKPKKCGARQSVVSPANVGIYQRGKSWCAYIKRGGQRRWIGSFDTFESAFAARKRAEFLAAGGA